MSDDLKNRLQKLEELTAHQSEEFEALSDTVREQWQKIDDLQKAVLRFRDRLTEVEETGGGHENTKPPHY